MYVYVYILREGVSNLWHPLLMITLYHQTTISINFLCKSGLNLSSCKVVIYNYVLCWLYFMTKSVVIVLIYFLVFCGVLLYWV